MSSRETLTTRPSAELRDKLRMLFAKIPPLWGLNEYVAVNPFVGFTNQPFVESAQAITAGLGAQVLPDVAYYRDRWREGAFTHADLQAVNDSDASVASLIAILSGAASAPMRNVHIVHTLAEWIDRAHGTAWSTAVFTNAALWCAEFARGRTSNARVRLFAFWRESASADRSLEIAGLAGMRAWVRRLPTDPYEAIALLLQQSGVSDEFRDEYLYRLLGRLFGWASWFRRASWAGNDAQDMLPDLLALLLAYDVAVISLSRKLTAAPCRRLEVCVEDEETRAHFQRALEHAYASRIRDQIAQRPTCTQMERPAVQAVFCIDVRSELMRRALEQVHPTIETIGFAGFFGVSVGLSDEYGESARCPVLIKPSFSIVQPSANGSFTNGVLKALQAAPSAPFTLVELLGPLYLARLLADALTINQVDPNAERSVALSLAPDLAGHGLALDARIDLATGILKNMGMHDRFARLVLLCAHESRSSNNPHAAGLACGACGGHSGVLNARIAAAVLNEPEVRDGVRARGWDIPTDTWFVAGIHDTSVDTVTLLDIAHVPTSHQTDLAQLTGTLTAASARVRLERAPLLGITAKPASLVERRLERRAKDWSEVRPEWGLARNAAFIAAPRARTRGVDLAGRAFLHEYDWHLDTDDSVLRLILSAPVVVASWINLQYFASTVDNDSFGCGVKPLQNRIGDVGVVLGNGGDLRTGLAQQSVCAPDGRWYHEPIRLQVLIDAPREKVDRVLDSLPDVRDLVRHGWISLHVLT